jgi:hypothetical protein
MFPARTEIGADRLDFVITGRDPVIHGTALRRLAEPRRRGAAWMPEQVGP